MTVENLRICYPKQLCSGYVETQPGEVSGRLKYGPIPKTLIPDGVISYRGPNGLYGENVVYYRNNGVTKLTQVVIDDNQRYSTRSQNLDNSVDKLSIKENKVKCGRKEYLSTHVLDTETGYETVVRKKGKEVIGGFHVVPAKRTFAEGLKGRLQKLGMAVATDANGCERQGLKNIGEMILKVAKKIK